MLVRFNIDWAIAREGFADELVPSGSSPNNHAGQRKVGVRQSRSTLSARTRSDARLANAGAAQRASHRVEARTVDVGEPPVATET
jgi:hypothetical protein